MRAVASIPDELTDGPFRISTATELGVERSELRGPKFQKMCRGVYMDARLEPTLKHRLLAYLLVLPPLTVVSHVSAARLWGFDPSGHDDLEFSTNTPGHSTLPGVALHRRRGWLTEYDRGGLPVTGPDRTFVDCALGLSFIELVQLGDHLIHLGATTTNTLVTYCWARHLHGVQRARRAARWVRAGAESPFETLIRLMLVFARLPEPELNVWITDANGHRVARVDMLFRRQKVIIEYDGRHHERDSRQWKRDRERREILEALGYRVIVIADPDLHIPHRIPTRVFEALAQRGYTGAPPVTSIMWRRWFALKV